MNWGKSIVVVLVLFIGFIMYFVISITTHKKSKHDLVTDKYYQQELLLNDKMKAKRNTNLLKEQIEIKKTGKGLEIVFPNELKNKKLKGEIFFYRPSNKVLDFNQKFVISDSVLFINQDNLLRGRWNISISFQYDKKDYLYTEEIVY